MNQRNFATSLAIAVGSAGLLLAQSESHIPQGKVERVKVHGKALEGNWKATLPIATSQFICRPATPPSETAATR
jgi:hypothetical protein